MVKFGGKQCHAPDTMSQNDPEARNGFLTISFYFITVILRRKLKDQLNSDEDVDTDDDD